MSSNTYETAEDQFVKVGGIRYAYRRFGRSHGVPLVLLTGFRGTMDHWDPALVNPLVARRPIVLIDNSGVGRSEGEIPKAFGAWAENYVNVLKALGLRQVDLMGFSMGGCVAQILALNAPGLIRRLILCATMPSTGQGVTSGSREPFNSLRTARTPEEHKAAFFAAFFNKSERSQAAAAAAWSRAIHSRPNKADYVSQEGCRRQVAAFARFMDPRLADEASFNRLHELTMPVLIVNGSNDLLIPTENSVVLWKQLCHANAQLHLYPDSGHGFSSQYPLEFAALLNNFLDHPSERDSRL